MAEGLANFAETTLNGAINNSTTTVIVTDGSVLPAVPFYLVIESEIMRVTVKSTNTLTVTRAQESTSAASHADQTPCGAFITVQTLKNAVSDYGNLDWLSTTQGVIPEYNGSAWQGLGPGTNKDLLRVDTGGSGSISWGSISNTFDNAFSSTQGSTLGRYTSVWDVISPGGVGDNLIPSTTTAPAWDSRRRGGVFGGRLSLESGVSLSVTDQLAKTTLYAVPHPGSTCGTGHISNYENSAWVPRTFTNTSLSLSGFTASLPYDIFGYWSSGVFTLDAVAWSSSTARATNLATQDGVYVKSGATSRLYLGTICITSSTGQCEFSISTRPSFLGIWNMYNRVLFGCNIRDSATSWTYNSSSWHSANASNSNRVTAITGIAGDSVFVQVSTAASPATGCDGSGSFGYDSTTSPATYAGWTYCRASYINNVMSSGSVTPTIGVHYYQWIEARINGSGTNTYFGSSTNIKSGMNVTIWA